MSFGPVASAPESDALSTAFPEPVGWISVSTFFRLFVADIVSVEEGWFVGIRIVHGDEEAAGPTSARLLDWSIVLIEVDGLVQILF